MKRLLLIVFSIFFLSKANAQSVAINTDGSTANASSILDVKSTAKGILIPRMSKAEKNAIAAPANGLLVYQNVPDSIGFHYYNGSSWVWLQNSNEGWSLNGNNNITASNYLGSINNSALRFLVNNKQSGIIDSTYQNTALGYQSLLSTGTSANNTAIGFDAGKNLTTGYGNAILGNKALAASTDGWENVAIGDSAMGNSSRTGYNVAVGSYALKNLNGFGATSANTAIGAFSQSGATAVLGNSPIWNTSVGTGSLQSNVTGYSNVAIGNFAMNEADSSSENVAIGVFALRKNNRTAWSSNVAIGSYSMYNDLEGFWNTAIGGEAMTYALRSTLNSAVGFRTLNNIKDGGENNTLGVGTMEFKDTALGCVAIGRFALSGNDAGSYLNNKPDTGSIAIGTGAGRFNNTPFNTFIGYASGFGVASNTLGISGGETVSIGAYSLNKLQSGASNSTFGYAALFNNISGNKNIAIGSRSLYGNIIGNYNVGIGDSALYFNSSLSSTATQGLGNIGIGSKSMWTNIYGSNNIALGREALAGNNDGDNNIGIGYRVGNSITSGSNNIFIGNSAGGPSNVSNKLFIENSNADKDNALMYGDFAADSLLLNAKTLVRNQLGLKNTGDLTGIELGYGSSKQSDAGKIQYGGFGGPAHVLNIVGAGSIAGAGTDRAVKIWAEGGTAINGNTDVDGFTRLGTAASGAPRIKTKKLTFTNGATGASTPIAHGLTQSKILSVSILINATTGNDVAPRNGFTGFSFDYFINASNIVIVNAGGGNDGSIVSRSGRILITYEE